MVTDTQSRTTQSAAVEVVTCDTCGFTEECTVPYIRRVRDHHNGKWLCGLCAEAVKDEVVRSPMRISVDEAVRRHSSFFHSFRHGGAIEKDPISAMGRILRRCLEGSIRTSARTNSTSSLPEISAVDSPAGESSPSLLRSGSCFSSLSTR
ncbi:PREDICTED: uncharacterized protein LOC104810994 [Tarenaya hassleriana]|uniref:uncharacterized protein LOC104810994 n=1 Tax=Tarenaya hassleriana TaxID=28532 RepID=UPI00053C227E|nr:PREDICTED: uncharacterized protein LOC104810994 [Tarenaya hassleriana]